MKKLIALILCAAMLLSMVGCTQNPVETTAPPTTVPTEPPADQVYAQARAALDAVTDISLALDFLTHTTVGGELFSERSVQTLTYKGIGSEDPIIVMEEKSDVRVHTEDYDWEDEENGFLIYNETWHQGTVYAELDGSYRFCGSLDAQAAAARYTPVVLLNAELYGRVTSEDTAEGTLITFAEPTAPEAWAVPEEAELVEATGTALVSAEGTLKRMTYTVTYLYGPAEVTLEVSSEPLDTPEEVSAPPVPDSYAPITSIDALRMTTIAPAQLLSAETISVSGLESMYCQAAGVLRNQSTVVNIHGRREETKVKMETGVYFVNYATGESEEYDLEETFLDGTLTTIENDGLPTTNSNVTWERIREYNAEQIVYGLLDMSFWQDVTISDMGSVWFLEYQLNENFGNSTQNDICDMLWGDPTFLYDLSSEYVNEELNGYLSVDKYTGIPVAAGFYYKGVHTIDGVDYPLTLQYDQSMEAPAKGAYQEITDEMPEEAEPENKPTPLFYHVTGEDGQEMWLFGTIHVGDERTAYLPQEIYDAFAASDALALECDTEAFDEQLEEDDELSQQVSSMYFYSGISLEVMMEEEEYAQAVKLMKATGNYNMNMPYAKPYLWSSVIDQFYMRQGYQLHSDQGVEERLCDWAEELDKEILEVESSMFQIKMLTGFSKDLQLLMLEESMEGTAQEYWEGTMDLYEKWCAGDEAVLREEVSNAIDTSEFTEEEMAEYEAENPLMDEYNQAVSYDRNEGMLEKAIEYLESGEVIFYAVGLAHLLDDVNGLVDALREAGYTVELVTYGG